MEFPDFFDPFNEYVPDYTGFIFDYDDGLIKSPDGEVFDSPATSIAYKMAEEGTDPNPTLKQLLENQFQANPPDYKDPADTLPDQPYQKIGPAIFFTDSSFARSVLTSEQNCKNKELNGWIVMPANQITAVRSRASSHQKNIPIVWLPNDDIHSDIRALFGIS